MNGSRAYLGVGLFCMVFLLAHVAEVSPHCEIPCGVYNDQMRLEMINEDISTIEKSMKQITELSKQKEKNFNQIVRWIQNKEEHADKIQHLVTQYFMTQRIKPVTGKGTKVYADYLNRLVLLHEMLVYAMKAKQSTDLANVERLKSLTAAFSDAYFGKKSPSRKQ